MCLCEHGVEWTINCDNDVLCVCVWVCIFNEANGGTTACIYVQYVCMSVCFIRGKSLKENPDVCLWIGAHVTASSSVFVFIVEQLCVVCMSV